MGPDSDSRIVDLGEFIRSQRSIAQMSLRRLSEVAGVSNPYLSQIERGLRKPSAEILQQIAKALRLSAETLYVRAGILDDEVAPLPDVAEAIQRDPLLTAEQKHTLLKVYESLVMTAAAEVPASAAPAPHRRRVEGAKG
jgi:transcriptional regulator with XRE-family HTH domain